MNDIRELNDAELETVSGGMDCDSAYAISGVYLMNAAVASAFGKEGVANYWYGKASGIMEGACR